ncbi:DUF732 domain-containing protein [Mycobacterium sp. CBMA293]|uniref:DUF732 domain-containing protein n=1 Tax=unclassified Mycolicibacterium TaxID=2636767 RepID=UPI0012DCB285|nr:MULTISPECIES: DUF732 domain-containing protein [unclassified Mycolicibacterium]MUL47888.1 DUF732 domain-containing protein [Mycolicibacterium sp. CBMA 360]MUL59264.1 DUF732 domain-containing protein [Mycolicibacterium sp. CBMA 335]MUL70989.1 DUF732 domain-containing protein [Mycolicibacterium sp. CBMA 311]MUL94632.1 DUF732 domain-containing protein [Mycolicibacterium sp. CBMA 230]MUM09190.1 hypothetical protein [Mycolicibacterium sp. CBMA 213]
MTATTEVTYRRQPVGGRPGRPKTGRTQVGSVDVIATSAAVLRPVVVAGAIIAAALMWGPRAHADVVHDALNDVGIGNNGPVSNVIAEVGTSICPLLVQPGSQMASTATQMSGNGGIAPPLAGFATQVAIQTQCPSFMTALANGNLPALMNGGLPVTPPGLPGMPSVGLPDLSGATAAVPGVLGSATAPVPGVLGAATAPVPGVLGAATAPVPSVLGTATAPLGQIPGLVSSPTVAVPTPGLFPPAPQAPLQLASAPVLPAVPGS